jgi:4'-phosphopantetheinyl transferase
VTDALTLGATEVQVWHGSLDQSPGVVERFSQILSDDEHARAKRFHFEIDRKHFIVARGYLRLLISRYQEIPPAEIQFAYSAYGKPQLLTSTALVRPFHFNLAHSGGIALYAFTRVGEIGVDVELIRPDFTTDDIAQRFFSPAEFDCLKRMSEKLRHEAFFSCWTRKEAIIKAVGTGLSLPLNQFDVTLSPGEPAKLLRTTWDESEAARWSLKAIDVGPNYAAAVAVAGHDWQLTSYQVDNEIYGLEPLGSRP